MTQVFISYSRKDTPFVKRLVADLRNAGLDVWYDVSNLGGGSLWRIEIENAIRSSQLFIAVLSPDSVDSEWVEREFLFASKLKRKIVPVMCRSCDLSLDYLNLNYIDMRGKKYQQGFVDLLKALAVDIASLPDAKIEKTSFVLKNKYAMAIVAALLVIIFAVLLNSPLFVNQAGPTATAASTPTESATATEYFTPTPIVIVVTSTESPPTASPTFTLTPTPENTATMSSSPEPEVAAMTVILQSTVDEGKAPLRVNFDARTSYVKFADGSLAACGNNRFCSYVFAVYRDGRLVEKISNNNGTLSYTFSAKGKYWATVYVCRGEACNDDGLEVNVK